MAWTEKDFKEKVEEMLQCKDFKDLVTKYGNQQKLIDQYQEQKKFAPDPIVVVENNIRNLEDHIRRLPESMTVINKNTGAEHFSDTCFEKIGYEWVKNGYNADRNTIKAFVIFRKPDQRAWLPSNFLLARSVPTGEWAFNNYRILMQLAKGGATAFYVAYLKDHLKRLGDEIENPSTFKIEGPTHSFLFDDTDLITKMFDSFKRDGFIKKETTKTDFNKLFSQKELKDFPKIDWRRGIGSLKCFIQRLPVTEKVRYKIAAQCFTVKGENITSTQLENNKPSTKDKEKIHKTIPQP